MANRVFALFGILSILVNEANCMAMQATPEPDPTQLYSHFVRMIQTARGKHKQRQFVAALLVSPTEVNDDNIPDEAWNNRFKVYSNTGKTNHGEVQLFNDLDYFFDNYHDTAEPLLLLFTTNIPCYRTDVKKKTDCSGHIKQKLEVGYKRKNKIVPYKLVVAFISVYHFQNMAHAERFDFTNLDKSLANLLSTRNLYLAYIIEKDTRNLLTIDDKTLDDIRDNSDKYALSNWVTKSDESFSNLRKAYPQCCDMMQHTLYTCLLEFAGGCACFKGNRLKPILIYAIDWAMKRCIHGTHAALHGYTNPLDNNKKNVLKSCLEENWTKHLGYEHCSQCRGDVTTSANRCINNAITAENVGCPPRDIQRYEGWIDCDRMDTGYNSPRFNQVPLCPQEGMRPEFLCSQNSQYVAEQTPRNNF